MVTVVIDIFKLVLVLVVMTGMIVLLVSLHHVMTDRHSLDDSDKDAFRRQVEEEDYVISEHSIFYKFFEREQKKPRPRHKPYQPQRR